MKKFMTLCVATTMALGLATTPVFADEATTTQVGDAAKTAVTNFERPVKRIHVKENKDQLIQKANAQLQRFENLIQTAIEKAKERRDSGLEKIGKREEKMNDAVTEASKIDSEEKQKLDNEIAKMAEYQQKLEDGINERITKADTNLQKALAAIDEKIAAAKDDATKQSLAAQKATLQSQADSRKSALQTYLTAIQGISADRQKIWNERKDLLARKQAADSDLRKALQETEQTNIDNTKTTVNKTDDQIESQIRARYQRVIDAIKAKIQRLQGQTPVSTQTTTVPATSDTTTVPSTTTQVQ